MVFTDKMLQKMVETVKAAGPGYTDSTAGLAQRVLGPAECGSLDLFSLDDKLAERCLEEGLLLDKSHHNGLAEGLPFNLDFIVRELGSDEGCGAEADETDGAASPEELEEVRMHIRDVRASVLVTLEEIDYIELQLIPQVRADWQLKIGCWECRLLEAEFAGRMERRRLALMRARYNQGEAITDEFLAAVEEELDLELAGWEAQVEKARQLYAQAMERIAASHALGKRQVEELKRIYRKLMRRLHPDVCRVVDEETTRLFALARAAYEQGSLEILRSLEIATRHLDAQDGLDEITNLADLYMELELAQIEKDVVTRRLEGLKNSEELRMQRELADPEWITAHTAMLQDAIAQWEAVIDDCRQKQQELRRSQNAN